MCIRVDVGGTRPYTERPATKTKKKRFVPTILSLRYCANTTCHKQILVLDKRISFIKPMETLSKGNLNDEMIQEMILKLDHENIFSE